MEAVKDLLDRLAATPEATLYYREGLMQWHQQGKAPLSEAIPVGGRKTIAKADEMIIDVLIKNPGMELQLLAKDSTPPYWIIYTNSPKKIELPQGMFVENGTVCFKRADGKTVMLSVVNP